MTRVALMTAVAIAATFAEPTNAFTSAEESCIDFSEDGRTIMYFRQNGGLMPEVMELMAETSDSIKFQNSINLMVIDAYDNYEQVPEDQRFVTVHLFAVEAMLNCLAAANKSEAQLKTD